MVKAELEVETGYIVLECSFEENNIPNAQRDVRATEVVASGNNTQVKFTPAPNKAYIVRVAELRIDKPDALSSNTEVGF